MRENPYCRFTWPVEPVASVDSVNLAFEHFEDVKVKLQSMIPEIPSGESPFGESVLLTHQCGQILEVGVSSVGWAIKLLDPQYGRFSGQTIHSLVAFDEHFEIGFNDPTYTDYRNTELHDECYALKMIERWLDTGHFPLFFAPGRNLGFGSSS